ncbi:uncharacterized protein PF3D7_1120000-like [Clytia hemisphaerica]|uniref:uncharacterized protein PF3D7_1120000-like n=1 Tax=Clytia hemisphaerica TaxID=252671 RepID=UPI0034D73D29
MGNSLSKEEECEKCLIYENKCKEYERHIQKINESHLEWRDLSEELRKEEVECVENFYEELRKEEVECVENFYIERLKISEELHKEEIECVESFYIERLKISEKLRKEEVECVENFYIERLKIISDAAVKVIKEERSNN